MCFVAGTFGVEALCAHTIAYNMIPLLFMIPMGLSMGLTVRMGHTLAAHDLNRTKQIAIWTMGLVLVLGAMTSIGVYHEQERIVTLFTNDPVVIEACKTIWLQACIYIWFLYMFGINAGIMRAFGMQWQLALWIVLCLWCGLLPSVIYWAMILKGGLSSQWSLLPAFYALMQVVLIWNYASSDWNVISEHGEFSRSKSLDACGASTPMPPPDEATHLIQKSLVEL